MTGIEKMVEGRSEPGWLRWEDGAIEEGVGLRGQGDASGEVGRVRVSSPPLSIRSRLAIFRRHSLAYHLFLPCFLPEV